MSHFGLLSFRGTGHLNPLLTLARHLIMRGHRVTVFQHVSLEQHIRQHGIEFFPIDIPSPQGITRQLSGRDKPLAALRTRLNRIENDIASFLREYPRAIRATGVNALLLGEISLAGPTVAEMFALPYFVISTSIPHNFGWNDPLHLAPAVSTSERRQDTVVQVSLLRMGGPIRRILNRHRQQLGLSSADSTPPALAHITQWPQCLDIPRSALPENFFYTGPFVDSLTRTCLSFPWHRVDTRPLVYASMGTTRRCDPSIFGRIAEACSALDLQLVVSLGGRDHPSVLSALPGNPIVVSNAPQLEILHRTAIVITHAGPNTAIETLLHGKPMLALPLALDQPAIAAHLVRLGVAEALCTQDRAAAQIRAALLKLLRDPRYSQAAQTLQQQLRSLDGPAGAADIIEARLAIAPREHQLQLTSQ